MERTSHNPGQHPLDDALEAYALGRLPLEQIAPFEEHLLVCPECQDAVVAHDSYILAMRTALRQPVLELSERTSKRGWRFGLRRMAWAGGLAAACAVLLVIPWTAPEVRDPQAVMLSSFRGSERVTMAHAPAGSPLLLGIDSTEATAQCRIEIVDAAGEPAWDGGLAASANGLQAAVQEGLAAGQYWVRLYAADSQLLQEFSLRID